MYNSYQINDDSEFGHIQTKTAMLNEVGRIATLAYEQGITLDEVKAICGAAYGDWREAQELLQSEELFFSE